MQTSTIKGCKFMMGSTGNLVVGIQGELPKGAATYTLRATSDELIFRADADVVARFPFKNQKVFDELTRISSIGAIEWDEAGYFPGCITNVLYTETMGSA